MDYVALHVACTDPEQAEILTAWLSDLPFESFETAPEGLTAYLPAPHLEACRAEIDALLAREGLAGRYERIDARNWNAAWESDYPRVEVEGRLAIRAPFHAPAPEGVTEVVVQPRMSFGTGHHATTWLMAREVLDMGVGGLRGLDMGSGTGVLAITAAKCGAAHVDAVDIDEWADESCRESVAMNGVGERVEPLLGDIDRVAGRRYDFILANINRNILTAHMPAYAAALTEGGRLAMSGFLEEDVPTIVAAARAEGLDHVATRQRDGWMLVLVKKPCRA